MHNSINKIEAYW